jgi:hypothetical protein
MMSDLRALRRPPSLFPFLKGILECCRALRAMRPAWRGGLSQDDATFATPESCMSERRQVKAGPRANSGYSQEPHSSRSQLQSSLSPFPHHHELSIVYRISFVANIRRLYREFLLIRILEPGLQLFGNSIHAPHPLSPSRTLPYSSTAPNETIKSNLWSRPFANLSTAESLLHALLSFGEASKP